MNMTFEDQIRERAYQIWQAGGMADGQAHEHWTSAEQAVRGEMAEPEVILTKAATKTAKPAAKAKTASKTAAKTIAAKTIAAKTAPKATRAGKAKPAAHHAAH